MDEYSGHPFTCEHIVGCLNLSCLCRDGLLSFQLTALLQGSLNQSHLAYPTFHRGAKARLSWE